jgi:hypothetical protein
MSERPMVWVPDPEWRTPSEYERCRQPVCPNPPVADLKRRRYYRGGMRPVWWAYCAEHLYGRRIVDGVVEQQVVENSLYHQPAAAS